MTMSNIELNELSIEELEAQRAVLLPPREELGRRRNNKKFNTEINNKINTEIEDSFNNNSVNDSGNTDVDIRDSFNEGDQIGLVNVDDVDVDLNDVLNNLLREGILSNN